MAQGFVLFALLVLGGFALLAVVGVGVKLGRNVIEPDNVSAYYAGVGGVMLIVAGGLFFLRPPLDTGVGMMTFTGAIMFFGFTVIFEGLAVMHAGGDDDGEQDRDARNAGDEQGASDRPLLE